MGEKSKTLIFVCIAFVYITCCAGGFYMYTEVHSWTWIGYIYKNSKHKVQAHNLYKSEMLYIYIHVYKMKDTKFKT